MWLRGSLKPGDLPPPVLDLLRSAETLIGMAVKDTAATLSEFGVDYKRHIEMTLMMQRHPKAAPASCPLPGGEHVTDIVNCVWHWNAVQSAYLWDKVKG